MKKTLDKFPYFNLSPSQQFQQSTKISTLFKETQKNTNNWPQEWVDVNFKGYPRFMRIKLPEAKSSRSLSLYDAFYKRHSFREYGSQGFTIPELSELLFHSAGVKLKDQKDQGNRPYPSAGARYPLEIYPLILNVTDLKSGIYHYHLRSHSLEYLWTFPNIKKVIVSNFNQKWIHKAAVIFVVSAVFWRMEVKYGDRGYRNTLMEAGMLTQNIYLTATTMNLACCSIGGFIDDKLHKLIDIDGEEEAVVTSIALGHY